MSAKSRTGLVPAKPRKTTIAQEAGVKRVSSATLARRSRSASPAPAPHPTIPKGVSKVAVSRRPPSPNAARRSTSSGSRGRPATPPSREREACSMRASRNSLFTAAETQPHVAPLAAHDAAPPAGDCSPSQVEIERLDINTLEVQELVSMYKKLFSEAHGGMSVEEAAMAQAEGAGYAAPADDEAVPEAPAVGAVSPQAQAAAVLAEEMQRMHEAAARGEDIDETVLANLRNVEIGALEEEVARLEQEAIAADVDADPVVSNPPLPTFSHDEPALPESPPPVKPATPPKRAAPQPAPAARKPATASPPAARPERAQTPKDTKPKRAAQSPRTTSPSGGAGVGRVYTDYTRQMEKVMKELEEARDDRRVLTAQNAAVESKCVAQERELEALRRQHVELHVSTQGTHEKLIGHIQTLLKGLNDMSDRVRVLEERDEARSKAPAAAEQPAARSPPIFEPAPTPVPAATDEYAALRNMRDQPAWLRQALQQQDAMTDAAPRPTRSSSAEIDDDLATQGVAPRTHVSVGGVETLDSIMSAINISAGAAEAAAPVPAAEEPVAVSPARVPVEQTWAGMGFTKVGVVDAEAADEPMRLTPSQRLGVKHVDPVEAPTAGKSLTLKQPSSLLGGVASTPPVYRRSVPAAGADPGLSPDESLGSGSPSVSSTSPAYAMQLRRQLVAGYPVPGIPTPVSTVAGSPSIP